MHSDLVLTGRETLKKEAEALFKFVDSLDESFDAACRKIFDCEGTTILTGMGKSGLVARKWASTFASTGTKSYFLNPADAPHGELGVLHGDDVLVALSYSGETEELSHLLRHAEDISVPVIGVSKNPQSSLAEKSEILLTIEIDLEACPLNLAPTTSTTVMMALGDAVAVTLMQLREFKEQDFARLHPGGSLGRRLWLKVRNLMHTGDQLPVVEADTKFENVLLEMTKKHLGVAIVCDAQKKVLGIVTDGDLRRCFQKRSQNGLTAKQMMTANPKSISPEALAMEARNLMEQKHIHHLAAVDSNGSLVGLLHLDDLLHAKLV